MARTSCSQTRLADDKILLNFGYNLTTLNSDIGGYRTGDVYQYTDLTGGGESVTQAMNGSLWWNPIEDLVIAPSFRLEMARPERLGQPHQRPWLHHPRFKRLRFERADPGAARPAIPVSRTCCSTPAPNRRGPMATCSAPPSMMAACCLGMASATTDSDLDRQKYVVGANWYPRTGLSVAAQYFHQRYDQDFSHEIPALPPLRRPQL